MFLLVLVLVLVLVHSAVFDHEVEDEDEDEGSPVFAEPALESGGKGEKDLEGGAFVGLALDSDGTAMFLDDAPGDEQSQAGAVRFGGEERLEQALHILGRDADAVIFDGKLEVRDVGGLRGLSGHAIGPEDVRRDREGAVWPHGFEGVQEEVHEGLLQLVIVTVQNVGRRLERSVQSN